jgi:integral membrane protein (TIGR00529 family)
MLALTRIRVHLGVSLLLGGVALSLWAGLGVAHTALNVLKAVGSAELWVLLVITVLIIELARHITREGNADEIVAATRRWGGRHGQAATLIALPAVIGLIPMPAGALFSAPFVEQAGSTIDGKPEWKTAVNYWFRHVWEYWWPLYPGVIVAMTLFEMDAWRFISVQFFFTPVAMGAGYYFLVRRHVGRLSEQRESGAGSNRRALKLMLPLGIVIASVFVVPLCGLEKLDALGPQMRKLLAVLIGLVAGLTFIVMDERRSAGEAPPRMFSGLRDKKSTNVLVTLTGVLLFKSMLEASGLLPVASEELLASGIPLMVAIACLPFLAGLVTGLALGFAGIAFPLIVGLMQGSGGVLTPMSTLVLAYGFGYMGMMLSPVHLCLLVSKEYFGSSFGGVYRSLGACALTVMVFGVAAHLVLRGMGW